MLFHVVGNGWKKCKCHERQVYETEWVSECVCVRAYVRWRGLSACVEGAAMFRGHLRLAVKKKRSAGRMIQVFGISKLLSFELILRKESGRWAGGMIKRLQRLSFCFVVISSWTELRIISAYKQVSGGLEQINGRACEWFIQFLSSVSFDLPDLIFTFFPLLIIFLKSLLWFSGFKQWCCSRPYSCSLTRIWPAGWSQELDNYTHVVTTSVLSWTEFHTASNSSIRVDGKHRVYQGVNTAVTGLT